MDTKKELAARSKKIETAALAMRDSVADMGHTLARLSELINKQNSEEKSGEELTPPPLTSNTLSKLSK